MIGKGFAMCAAAFAAGFAVSAAAGRDWPLPPERPNEPPFTAPGEVAASPNPPPPEAAKPEQAKPEDAKPEAAAPSAAPAAACLARLKALGAEAEAAPPPPTPIADCGVDQPVTVAGVALASGDRLAFPARPLLACAFAEIFVSFARDLAAPLGAATLGARIAAVDTGPGYECRPRNHVAGAKTSAHGLGLAIDVMGFETADKRRVAVERQDDAKGALYIRTMRTAACGWFMTVLGPGADAAHATHLHLDTLRHGSSGAYRICE